jgi:D-lactate dehydrogenase (cytochrome)
MATAAEDRAVDWTTLRTCFGERFSQSQAVRDHHGRAETFYPAMPPDAVVYPLTTEEVATAVLFCKDRGIAVTPYGTGTSLEGNFLAVRGGLCIDLSRMDQVLRVSTDDLDCTVQAGVTRKQLNMELRDTGLFFPVDPGADASLGGMPECPGADRGATRRADHQDRRPRAQIGGGL